MQKRSGLGNATLFAAGLLLLSFVGVAGAQRPATVTLVCEGDLLRGNKSLPVTVSLVLNFTDGTVQQDIVDYPVKLTAVDDAIIEFSGSRDTGRAVNNITGRINRVTGSAGIVTDVKTSHKNRRCLQPTM